MTARRCCGYWGISARIMKASTSDGEVRFICRHLWHVAVRGKGVAGGFPITRNSRINLRYSKISLRVREKGLSLRSFQEKEEVLGYSWFNWVINQWLKPFFFFLKVGSLVRAQRTCFPVCNIILVSDKHSADYSTGLKTHDIGNECWI